ncbi:hypothetical protein JAAARDRAFT_201170 [Jaapia argillacea MUCL 33604]|uniref:Uncharacterized protein n=1 Tax=Jaapia argillacea MUCL 33604 TaxID=933084 RepID=A0A067PDG6_9AGAM|nr:hypothetical protein JAAARDRAFT_201170 [Jaapia argillacea MUCL 33604]
MSHSKAKAPALPQGNNTGEPPRCKHSAPSKVIGTKLAFLQARNAEWLQVCDQQCNWQGSQKMEKFLDCITKLWFLKYEDLPFKKDLNINKPNPELLLLDMPQQLTDAEPAQLFLWEYHTEVYAIFAGRWEEELLKAKAASKKPLKKVTILMKVTQELLAKQPESFCAEIDQMVLDDYIRKSGLGLELLFLSLGVYLGANSCHSGSSCF